MTPVSNFRSLLSRDVSFEDESRNFFVALRLCTLLAIAYYAALTVLSCAFGMALFALLSAVFLCLTIPCFYATYRLRSKPCFVLFSTMTVLWILVESYMLGRSCNAHILVVIVILLRFFTTGGPRRKIIFAGSMCAFWLIIYMYTANSGSYDFQAEIAYYLFGALNMLAMLAGTTTICWFFSEKTQAAEMKLVLFNQRLQEEAGTDQLTGLINRRKMAQHLERCVSNAYSQQASFTIAIGDIDHFKGINDSRGHDCGDVVLREISDIFRTFMADKGFVARWGGEEFLFLFVNMNGDEAWIEMDKLLNIIRAKTITYREETFQVTLTFGMEEFNVFESDHKYALRKTIDKADDKLYTGKKSGRNRIVY